MNFVEEYKKGQRGENKGIGLGEGLAHISNVINGVQKGRIYVLAAAPKVGKSALADYAFVISPYLEMTENPSLDINWIYYSWEIDRVSKEFEYAAYFLFHDYQITHVELDKESTKHGQGTVELSAKYLRGRLVDDQGHIIKVKPRIEEVLKEVYKNRIIPLFGEHSDRGELLTPGRIQFVEEKNNPTGIYKHLLYNAEKHGKFIKRKMGDRDRIIGYKPDDSNRHVIVISDHVRKLILERGWDLKRTVDKYSDYTTELRNFCGFSFVHIIHLNRNLSDISRQRHFGDRLYPGGEDVKDTGNLSEDADFVFTMFNPNDDRYNLRKHFGIDIRKPNGDLIYPDMRTIHLVDSRHCEFPQHFSVLFRGGCKNFETFLK